MSNNVVFLDIDGVLNSTRFYETNKPLPMGTAGAIDPEAVAILNLITDRPGVYVVLSTSWRMQGTGRIWGYLRQRGFKGEILGATPTLAQAPRSEEIREWLYQAESMGFRWNRYVVLDDLATADPSDGLFGTYGRFVHCNHVDGLTEEGVGKVAEWFGYEALVAA